MFEVRDDMWHYTPLERLSLILQQGLRINSPSCLVQRSRYHNRFGCRPLFLTNNPDSLVGSMVPDRDKFVLLRVNLKLKVVPENLFYRTSQYVRHDVTNTFVCFDNVEPNYISMAA